jgi:hypothetical protein
MWKDKLIPKDWRLQPKQPQFTLTTNTYLAKHAIKWDSKTIELGLLSFVRRINCVETLPYLAYLYYI